MDVDESKHEANDTSSVIVFDFSNCVISLKLNPMDSSVIRITRIHKFSHRHAMERNSLTIFQQVEKHPADSLSLLIWEMQYTFLGVVIFILNLGLLFL